MNQETSRRAFLGATLAGLTAGNFLSAAEKEPAAVKAIEPPAPLSTLFLTWQRDPTTTMTVQWVGRESDTPDTRIHYAVAKSTDVAIQPTIARAYPKTDLKMFRAELTGLKPGTDYEFRVGAKSTARRFRTMPAKATDTISFISGGDSGANSHAIANNIQAARQDPMFAVIGGDIAYENGKSADIHLSFLKNYSKHMIGRNDRLIPLLGCLGNHEADGGYGQPRTKAPFFFSMFDGLFPETGYATLDFGDYLSLVLLDTGHCSQIAGAQTAWLEKSLKERADHPNVFVVNHVPAYPSYRNPEETPSVDGKGNKAGTGDGNRKYWVPLFDKYRVPVVLEHHDHTFKRTKTLVDGTPNENGVLYLGDGSWGKIRAPKDPEKISYLATSSRDYHLSLHRIQGEQRFHLALDENGRVMDVSRSGQRLSGLNRATKT